MNTYKIEISETYENSGRTITVEATDLYHALRLGSTRCYDLARETGNDDLMIIQVKQDGKILWDFMNGCLHHGG
jgi:hypothetical protein